MIKLAKNLKWNEYIYFLIGVGIIVLQVYLELEIAEYMGKITTLIQTGSTMPEILEVGGYMILFALGGVVCSVISIFAIAKIAVALCARLRVMLYDKVQSFTMDNINKFSISSLITRSTNDIQQIQMFWVMGMALLIKSPIVAIWTIARVANTSWQWTLATAIAIILLILIAILFLTLVVPKFKRLQKETDDINRVARENLTGLKVVRAYNAEKYQENKFDNANNKLTKTNLFTNRAMAMLFPSIGLLMNGLMLAIYWIGAGLMSQVESLKMIATFSDMMSFTLYATQLLMAFLMLIMVFMFLPRAQVSANRISEVLNTESTIKYNSKKMPKTEKKGTVEFKNVSFSYDNNSSNVINNISFSINQGETLALIGATGSGKSSIINLIPRLYDATEGEVLINGINVKDYNELDLKNVFGYISQKAKLFTGTIASNVTFGKTKKGKPSFEDMKDAIRISQSEEFVDSVDGKYDGYVAQNGTNYSGGQKQRLSIARALARKPEILIFDDSFSALDYKTDTALRKAIKKSSGSTTLVIVAQRIGTIKNADRILVIEKGEIVGNGIHKELLENCEVYKEIAYSQLSKEELEV